MAVSHSQIVYAVFSFAPVLLAVIVAIIRVAVYGRTAQNVKFGLRLVTFFALAALAFNWAFHPK